MLRLRDNVQQLARFNTHSPLIVLLLAVDAALLASATRFQNSPSVACQTKLSADVSPSELFALATSSILQLPSTLLELVTIQLTQPQPHVPTLLDPTDGLSVPPTLLDADRSTNFLAAQRVLLA